MEIPDAPSVSAIATLIRMLDVSPALHAQISTLVRSPLLQRAVMVMVFLSVVAVSLGLVGDYGVPFDEGTMDSLGSAAYERVFHGTPWSETFEWRFHGPIVEFATFTFIETLRPLDPSVALQLRHSIVTLYFACAVWILYWLGKRVTGDWRLAVLGCVMLVLSPRIFAHGFYNSRDIPNLTFMSLAMLTLLRFLDRRTVARAALHGLCCALALALRTTALLLPALTLLFIVLSAVEDGPNTILKNVRRVLPPCAVYLGVLLAFTIFFWPLLWENPVRHIIDAVTDMASHGGANFYMGAMIEENPWHYVPVWITISTPLPYTLLFLLGCLTAVFTCAGHPRGALRMERPLLLCLLWFFAPILAIIALQSGIYQEWRHLFFVYPAFLLIALRGWQLLARAMRGMTTHALIVLWMLTAAALLPTARWVIRNHPFEYAYFSMPTSWVQGAFDLDYWGLSYRQAFAYIFRTSTSDSIGVYAEQNIAYVNGEVLFPTQRSRWRVADPQTADYIIDRNAQDHPSPYRDLPIAAVFVVDGLPIRTIYHGPGHP